MESSKELLEATLQAAAESGVKLEMVEGIPSWEAYPSPIHQIVLSEIDASVWASASPDTPCGCHRYQDTYQRFPDGSFKRPDLAIHCAPLAQDFRCCDRGPGGRRRSPVSGFEHKDLVSGPPFYLKHGVLDVIVVDPGAGTGKRFTAEAAEDFVSPTTITLKSGCTLTA